MTFLRTPTDDEIVYLRTKLQTDAPWQEAVTHLPPTTTSQFVDRVTRTPSEHERSLRLAPSTFLTHSDPSSLKAVPIPKNMRWETLTETLSLIGARGGVLNIAPLIWHTEFLAHDSARAHGVPISVTQPENLPLALSILEQVEMELAIVGHAHYSAFVRLLREKKGTHTPTAIIRVTPLAELQMDIFPLEDVFKTTLCEVHLLPGCPLLFQTLSIAGSALYHLNPNFLWEQDLVDGTVRITELADTVPSLSRLTLPFQIEREDANTTETAWKIVNVT